MKFDSQYQNNICHKLDLDQYYTPVDLAKKCFDKFIELYGHQTTELYEASAGTGAFIDAFKTSTIPYQSIDIDPKRDDIPKGDFLEGYLDYKKGRAFVGNPPFGAKLVLAQKFYKRCVETGDFIAWILPISQLNNNASMYEFNLVYSEDLGDVTFSGSKPVKCCFNIYARNEDGSLNPKPSSNLKDVSFMRNDSAGYKDFEYDFRMTCWGGRAGQLLKEDEPDLSMVYKIKVNNPELVDKVRRVLEETDWMKVRPSVSCKKVQKIFIVNELKKQIPEIM